MVTVGLTARAVTTHIDQARARERRTKRVLVATFIAHNLLKIKGKVNKKNFLAINFFFW